MAFTISKSSLLALAETFALAAAGGALFGVLGFPAGWLAGAILFVSIAALSGRPMRVPLPLARVFFVVIGITLGGVVTPETVKGVAEWPLSIVAAILSTLCVTVATSRYLMFVHGWESRPALFASFPGAMSQVVALAAETGADLRPIVIVQTLRVVILTFGVPLALGLFGVQYGTLAGAAATATTGMGIDSPVELAILCVASGTAAVLAHWARFPGGLIFGAMIMSAVLHGSGLIHAKLPWWFSTISIVGLGAVVGSRFAQAEPRLLLRYLGAAFGSFAVALAVTGMFAGFVTSVLKIAVADAVVAFAPGAVDAMMILALAMHLDPVYVGAHHVARVLMVGLSLPVIARWLGLRGKGQMPPQVPPPPAANPPRLGGDD
jgi:membrane AbrB-like protein